ncbi:ELMO domain-containing protein 2-like [Macrosteles quadrilineatus]|uniref:ELMO domain-containing protein 2-like n=1 Tax=Macrosteles quadrilineatus TaxID=74068 RepID=UPI0023E19DB0|nr:ELMO domain-containing protein 2-like [Macrosteles quadrilineatus]XP_054280562.1 ELMO domain-containing protein 2-like [Macrosteles quadrilineatus]
MSYFHSIYTYLYWIFRPCIKWFLRKTTKLCELQRICYGEPVGYPRSNGVEVSLNLSKNDHIKDLVQYLNKLSEERKLSGPMLKVGLEKSVYVVVFAKKINPTIHRQFLKSFGRCVEHIWGYRQLLQEIENWRLTMYDSENKDHEEKLLKLWKRLKPDEPLQARVSKQWQDIGFQGDDPKTDFRGMGILGLDNLLYFAEEFPGPASHVLSHSLHPQYGYAFAIVGINLTSMAYHLFKDGTAKTHVYNVSKSFTSIRTFHQFYCYLFYEFDKYWLQAKPNIMEFSFVKEKFEANVRSLLSNPSAVCRINIAVDTV